MIKVVRVPKIVTPNYMYGGRPSRLGNPFTVLDHGRGRAIEKFTEYWYAPEQRILRLWALQNVPENAELGCWCHPDKCHLDIVAGYLNWKRSTND